MDNEGWGLMADRQGRRVGRQLAGAVGVGVGLERGVCVGGVGLGGGGYCLF